MNLNLIINHYVCNYQTKINEILVKSIVKSTKNQIFQNSYTGELVTPCSHSYIAIRIYFNAM